MAKKRKGFDRLKVIRSLSRKEFGRPGQGRKTRYVDRRKKADRESCRKKEEDE